MIPVHLRQRGGSLSGFAHGYLNDIGVIHTEGIYGLEIHARLCTCAAGRKVPGGQNADRR